MSAAALLGSSGSSCVSAAKKSRFALRKGCLKAMPWRSQSESARLTSGLSPDWLSVMRSAQPWSASSSGSEPRPSAVRICSAVSPRAPFRTMERTA